MNPRTTGLLALVAMLLGGFIYFYELEGESSRQAALDDEQRIHPGLESDAVERIELSTQDGLAAQFERVEGRWMMTSPVASRADSTALDAMAHALTSLPREGAVADPGELAEYGLAEDARIIRFVADGKSLGLRLGRSTPVGGHVYMARLADDEVMYVESYRTNAFNRNLDDLRERRVLNFDEGELQTLRISWPAAGGTTEVALALDDSDIWQMGFPATGRADQQTLRDVLSNLSFLRATSFVDEHTVESDAALANPTITFHWTLRGDHAEKRLRIGSGLSAGDSSPVVEGPFGQRVMIDAERVADFPREVVAYRFKMLSKFDLVEARQFELDFQEEGSEGLRVEARLDESGWSSADPEIDSSRASDLVRELSSLRAVDILAEEMGPAELASLGLSPARVRIRIRADATSNPESGSLADISIGRLDAGRGLFAMRDGAATIYVLPESAADAIPISRAAFYRDFEVKPIDSSTDAEELDLDGLEIDPLEGIEIP